MSGSAVIATTIFGLAMVATILVGLLSGRGRDKSLTEWSVSSRGLGVLFVWLLMAGETYTSFSFLGTAGWSYSYGAPILYLVAYLTVGLAVAYVAGPAIWTYATRHNLISIADMAEHRFRSRPVGMLVAIVATVFLVPYIQLQIQGMGVVVNAMSYGGVDLHVAAVVSFVVAEAFILVSGLRGSAWVSALKDVLVIFAVVFLAVYVPVHYVHGAGAFMNRMVTEKPEWLTFPGHDSGGRGAAWFISTVLLNGVTIVIFPNTVASYFERQEPERAAAQLAAAALVPAAALHPDDGRRHRAVRHAGAEELRPGAVHPGHEGAAVAARRDHRRGRGAVGDRADERVRAGDRHALGQDAARRRQRRRSAPVPGGVGDARTKVLSQVVCFLAGLVALAGSLFYPSALVQLSVLSYEGLAQLVPVVLLALFWRRMSAAGAVAGLLTGTAIMLALWLADHDPLYGVNAG